MNFLHVKIEAEVSWNNFYAFVLRSGRDAGDKGKTNLKRFGFELTA